MLIRAKYHWLMLYNTVIFGSVGIFMLVVGSADPFYKEFMVPFWLTLAAASAIGWSSIYTTLSNGVLTKHVFWFKFRSFSVSEITRIVPHRKNGVGGRGIVADIYSSNGQKLTLQPNHPEAFLAMLHRETPQAEYLF